MPVSDVTSEEPGRARRGVAPEWSEFGALLRRHRRRAGLTQSQLGLRVGYHHSLISKWESGLRELPAPLVAHLDAVLATGGALATVERGLRGGEFLPAPRSALGQTLFTLMPPGPAAAPALPAYLASVWPVRLPAAGIQCPLHGRADCPVPEFVTLPGLLERLDRLEGLERRRTELPAADDADVFHALAALLNLCAQAVAHRYPMTVLGLVEQVLRAVADWGRALDSTGRAPYAQLRLAGHYAQIAGRLRLQRGQNGLAMNWFHQGLRWADSCGDLTVQATLLTDICTLSRLENDGAASLGQAQALAALEGRQPWIALLSHMYRARGLAMLGAEGECRAQLTSADRLFDALGPADLAEAPWLSGDEGSLRLEASAAAAYRDLAAHSGDRATALRAVTANDVAQSCTPPDMVPVRLMLRLRHADALACAGEPEGALAVAAPVLTEAVEMQRLSVTHELRGLLGRLTNSWSARPGVRDFRDSVRTAEDALQARGA